MHVYSSSVNYHHEVKLTSYVKGVERNIVKKRLLNLAPSTYKERSLLRSSTAISLSGNLQNIKSDATLRKIKQEATSTWDRSKDYIQEVYVPFKVKLYGDQQIKLAEMQKMTDTRLVLYFDATGGVVRPPTKSKQKIYLYSGVIQITKTREFAVFLT